MMPTTIPAARTLPALLSECASGRPDREALVAGDRRFSYADLDSGARRIARGLARIGVEDGDVVALLAPNTPEWLMASFGALGAGARVDAFNTWVRAYDLEQLLSSSGASTLILADRVRSIDLLAELESLVPEMGEAEPGQWSSARFPKLRAVVVLGSDSRRGTLRWGDLLGDDSDSPAPAVAERGDGPAFVLYTSGSTTAPKAVPLRHRDLIVNGFHIGERMGLSGRDRVWLGSPLFWSYGCANALMATMAHGACLVLQEQFEPDSTATLMDRERVTAAYLLPAIIDALAEAHNGEVARHISGLDSLRTGLTIGRPDEVRRAAVTLGVEQICNVYGSTETYGNCCVTDHREPLAVRLHTQGAPLPGVEVRVIDQETGLPVPAGTPGELHVRGRVMSGYLNNQESNLTAFTADGWYRTGDRMIVTPDGAVAFVGRITDMIKTSGINVSPAEVESYLSTHPDIAEVVVLGAPHPSREQVVVAFVVSRSGELVADEVIAYCKGRIAGYKVPWAVAVVTELPRTGTGKLLRRGLHDDAASLVESVLAEEAR
ncbi:fatty-acyl-CoA synthase [Antricoccus suffuscus]|uniref:Fatty-acyl-CoA synthase n=1 Tax=Antricoccus suffuscus TaxID=1629062 RepID=A0A2T1A151_9ACTN|nr:fatty-acyl-CoA synthase [Antricoccus suffuscus]